MPPDPAAPTVHPDVLAAAWDMVRLLDATQLSERELKQALYQHVDQHRPLELFRGHLLLAGVLAQRIAESTETVPAADPEHVEPLELVKVVLTRLRNDFPDVPTTVLPTLAAVLTGGLLGEDVLAWAEDHVHGPTTAEALGMVCLVACLASLHDALSQPDAAHELFTAVFASSPRCTDDG